MESRNKSEWMTCLKKDRPELPKHIRVKKPKKTFVTGSTYHGEWMDVQMWGKGTYVMPHKVRREGRMVDGMFHGSGILCYPAQYKIDGIWSRGHLIKASIIFPDDLEYTYPFEYCKKRDRRFYSTITDGFKPAPKERLTNDEVPRKIPPGCYDCGYGFYDPQMRCVISAEDLNKTIKIPSAIEENWIKKYCRKAWDEPVGHRPDLYERWTNGSEDDRVALSPSSSSRSIDDSMLECLMT